MTEASWLVLIAVAAFGVGALLSERRPEDKKHQLTAHRVFYYLAVLALVMGTVSSVEHLLEARG